MNTPAPELIESRPLSHGLTALIVRRCPNHPIDNVTNRGECVGCALDVEPYGRTGK